MKLVMKKPTDAFNLERIRRGCLLWGRHSTWDEGKAGFVTSATEEQLIVQYYPGIGNVTNHFKIPVSEVTDGQWEIRWSVDLSELFEYTAESEDEVQEVNNGDTGGVDLSKIS